MTHLLIATKGTFWPNFRAFFRSYAMDKLSKIETKTLWNVIINPLKIKDTKWCEHILSVNKNIGMPNS